MKLFLRFSVFVMDTTRRVRGWWWATGYKKKLLIITVAVFAILFVLYLNFGQKISLEIYKNKITLPETFPQTDKGLWNPYIYKDRLIPYPPDWTLNEHMKPVKEGQEDDHTVLWVEFTPAHAKNPADMIGVGGIVCASGKYVLCVGNEPIYTNSHDPEVLQTITTMIKNTTKYESKKK